MLSTYINLSLYELNDISFFTFKDSGTLPAASLFGFIASAAYGLDTFFTYVIWKAETRTSTTVGTAETNGQANGQQTVAA